MTQSNPNEKTKEPVEQVTDATSTAFQQLMNMNAAGLDAWMKSTDSMLKATNSMSQEIIDFADKRMKAVWDTTQSMVKCNTLSEAYELQSNHTRSAVEEYLAEANRMMSLTAEATKNGWSPIQESVSSALHGDDKPQERKTPTAPAAK